MNLFKKLALTSLLMIMLPSLAYAGTMKNALTLNDIPLTFSFKRVDTRVIQLYGPIDFGTAESVAEQLYRLDAEDPGKPILIKIDSPGGYVYAGFEIYDAMNSIKSPIYTECVGICMSMAAVILASGEAGHRSAKPNSTILIHTLAGGMEGHIQDLRLEMKESERQETILEDMLVKHTGVPKEKMQAEMAYDNSMAPTRAKELNLIDIIEEPVKK